MSIKRLKGQARHDVCHELGSKTSALNVIAVVSRRIAQRCAAALETQTFVSVLPRVNDKASELRAAVIARGNRKVAAEILARGKPQGAIEAQALTPFAINAGRSSEHRGRSSKATAASTHSGNAVVSVLSVQDAAAVLYEQLVSSNSRLTPQTVVKLLCATGSPGEQPQEFDVALSQGFAAQMNEITHKAKQSETIPAFFSAAVQHIKLHHGCAVSPKGALLLERGGPLTELKYLT